MTAFTVSDRISVSDHLGTIRFVGSLPTWGDNVVAYGVEWDDCSRGKNNGDHDDVQYFTTKIPGAGSFIKATNKSIDRSVSFFEAVADRYSSKRNAGALSETITIGTKTIESFGFGKLNAILNNVETLPVIMVDHQKIRSAGSPSSDMRITDKGRRLVFHAETLDLSSNLLTDWCEIEAITKHFPGLKSLNLNGNRLSKPSVLESENDKFTAFPKSVTDLSLSATFLHPSTLSLLDLASISKLDLSANGFEDAELAKWNPPHFLSELDLSFNQLSVIPKSFDHGSLTSLTFADNKIGNIKDLPVFEHVRKLDLRRNPIADFQEVDAIGIKFPCLEELRLNDCPVFDTFTPDEMTFTLVGRLKCEPLKFNEPTAIYKLNGSTLSAQEIRNAELYFISKVRTGDWAYSNPDRWHSLLQKYGFTENLPEKHSIRDDRKIALSIRRASEPEKELFSRIFLQRNTVLRLKGIISKNINRYVLDFSLSYYINDDSTYQTHETMNDDIASLQSLGLVQNHRIYVL